MHETEKWKWSRSVVSDPQRPHGLQPTRLLCPWDFPGKSTRVGCHCLLCLILYSLLISSAQFSYSVVSDSLRPYGLQHVRPPCPSPTPGVYPNCSLRSLQVTFCFEILWFFFFFLCCIVGSWFPNQGSGPCALNWEHWILTTEPKEVLWFLFLNKKSDNYFTTLLSWG